jgi:divinyl protochlorophyllide a 8-vinyl-reductase
MPNGAEVGSPKREAGSVKACGGGTEQMREDLDRGGHSGGVRRHDRCHGQDRPERDPATGAAARLHQALRTEMPEVAPMLAREAGWRTADYILAHRIPKKAQTLLKLMPARLSAPILARAVEKHAWTFCGSGGFSLVSKWPVVFEIADNPVVRGEHSDTPLCHWHAAVFERLFSTLCGPDWRCTEAHCCAQGAPACHFEMSRD